jgi:hypothetical protein|tara:strand:- start:453 stop:605 length:153 start_codon:yes stop_codon:yes gene_type:complete
MSKQKQSTEEIEEIETRITQIKEEIAVTESRDTRRMLIQELQELISVRIH